jgi:Predicted transcriptional regulators
MTQQQLADAIGVEEDSTVRRWENGNRWPGANTIEKLAKVLDIRVRDLFTFPDRPDI